MNSVADILLFAFIAVSFVIYTEEYCFLGAKAFRFTFLFIPSTVILIWQTAKEESLISKLLSIPVLVKIGDLSPYTFLIHGVSIKYTGLFLLAFFRIENVILTSLVSFGTTILAAVIWKKFWCLLTSRQTAAIR